MADKIINLADTLSALFENKKFSTLRDILMTLNPADIAIIFEELPEESLPFLFRLLPKEMAAETFVEMDTELQQVLIRAFSDVELHAVISELYIDDAVDIVEEMPANVVKRILKQADPETRNLINELLKYPESSAGSIMTPEYVDLRPEMTAREAIEHVRKTGVDRETINYCYVTAKTRELVGLVSIRALILADSDSLISDIMESNVISVGTLDDREHVAQLFGKYSLIAIPVVDGENRLVGIVTVDDAIEVLKEETTEDMEKMAAILPSEKPYLKTSTFEIWKSRVPWLLFLLISATFTGMIISSFENALAAEAALVAFIPMLMDTGGNAGSQASVTIIRGLSLGEVSFRDILSVAWKELRVSLLCAVSLSAVAFCKIQLIDNLLLGQGISLMIAAVVCITLVITVIVAKLIGCTLPMIAKKLGFDPAVMASPLITTIVDAVALLVYFAVATALLQSI